MEDLVVYRELNRLWQRWASSIRWTHQWASIRISGPVHPSCWRQPNGLTSIASHAGKNDKSNSAVNLSVLWTPIFFLIHQSLRCTCVSVVFYLFIYFPLFGRMCLSGTIKSMAESAQLKKVDSSIPFLIQAHGRIRMDGCNSINLAKASYFKNNVGCNEHRTSPQNIVGINSCKRQYWATVLPRSHWRKWNMTHASFFNLMATLSQTFQFF